MSFTSTYQHNKSAGLLRAKALANNKEAFFVTRLKNKAKIENMTELQSYQQTTKH